MAFLRPINRMIDMSMNFQNGSYRRIADLGLGVDWNVLTDGVSENDPAGETTMTDEGTGGMIGSEDGGAVRPE